MPAKSLHPNTPGLDRTGSPKGPPKEDAAAFPKTHLPEPTGKPGEDRPTPDYERRPAASADAGDVLVWVPRVLLYPVHLTLEYLVRWPVVGGVTLLEKYHLIERTKRLFTWRDGKAGIYPTALVDFGLSPSVGFLAFYEDLITEGDTMSLQGGFWDDGWLHLAFRNRSVILRDDSANLRFLAEFTNRPDWVFYGVGAGSADRNESHYRFRSLDVRSDIDFDLGDLDAFQFALTFRRGEIMADGEEVAIDQVFDVATLDGFVEDYTLIGAEMSTSWDTRSPEREFTPGSGVRLDVFGKLRFNPTDTDLALGSFGAELAGFWDVTGLNHVFGASLYAEMQASIGDGEVPFTELISLGGDRYLRGYLPGRLLGQSAIVASVNYRYPVWSFIDADLFFGAGNVFQERFKDFDFDRLLLNWGLGLRTNAARDSSFDILIAFGSNRLDEDKFRVDNVRFSVGLNHGF